MTGATRKLVLFCTLAVCITLSNGAALKTFFCPDAGVFPTENINYFYLCEYSGTVATSARCPEGRGFLRNNNVTGCVPFEDWECTNKIAAKPDCSKDSHFNKLHDHLNPNNYWACPHPQGTNAILMTCPEDRVFTENDDFYGCVDLKDWKCTDLEFE